MKKYELLLPVAIMAMAGATATGLGGIAMQYNAGGCPLVFGGGVLFISTTIFVLVLIFKKE